MNNVLEHIGGTPMVRINRIGKEEGLQCELVTSRFLLFGVYFNLQPYQLKIHVLDNSCQV